MCKKTKFREYASLILQLIGIGLRLWDVLSQIFNSV